MYFVTQIIFIALTETEWWHSAVTFLSTNLQQVNIGLNNENNHRLQKYNAQ